MIYDIVLNLVASYEIPASGGRHLLCVAPQTLPQFQTRHSLDVDIEPPPDERVDRVDFFGNPVTSLVFRQPHAVLNVRMRARIERHEPRSVEDASPALDALSNNISAQRSLAPDSPHHFLSASARVRLAPEVAAWARTQLRSQAQPLTTLQAVILIGRAIHEQMTFDAGATTVDTPMETAFANRHGVCQDFSHIMISALRGVGVPAGYVSGYLRTLPPPGMPRLEGADAMHAWVRAWCGPAMGWVEYDPTNAVLAGQDHIVAAYGRDYSDVSPMRGVLRTAGAQTTGHTVDVAPVGAP